MSLDEPGPRRAVPDDRGDPGGDAITRSRTLLEGLLKLCVAAACLVGAIAAYRLLLHPLIESAFSLGEHALSIVRRVDIFFAAVLSYWAFVRYYERRAAQELSLPWRWMVLAAVAGAGSIGATILALYATGHYQLMSLRGFGQAPGILGTIWIAAVIEEVAFRGILFRILEERIGTRVAAVASAAIFSVAHLANNGVQGVTLISVTLAGLMWAGVFILSRNIWVVAVHHCCWNATIFMIGLPLSGENWRAQAPLVTDSHGSVLWTGGDFGPEDSLVNIVVGSAICVALWRLARHAGNVSAARAFEGGSLAD
jgi:membrane protease YdiL (CAAX protease family)